MQPTTLSADMAKAVSVPLSSRRDGRLELAPGASRLTLRGGAPDGELVLASFEGREPSVDESNGTVVINYPRLGGLRQARTAAEIALSSGVRWGVFVRGGASRTTADLREVELAAIEIGGGASELELSLGRPRGTVPVRVQGGASRVTVTRPGDVAVRLRVEGGVAALAFDEQRLGSAGGGVRLLTPGWHDADDRYDVEISGGASVLSVSPLDGGKRPGDT